MWGFGALADASAALAFGIFPGLCADSTGATVIDKHTSFTPIDLAVVGAGGRDQAAAPAAFEWWYYFVIADGGGTVSSLASLSATAPTLPAPYVVFRRVGSVQIDGTATTFRPMQTSGNGVDRQFLYSNPDPHGPVSFGAGVFVTPINVSPRASGALVTAEVTTLAGFAGGVATLQGPAASPYRIQPSMTPTQIVGHQLEIPAFDASPLEPNINGDVPANTTLDLYTCGWREQL